MSTAQHSAPEQPISDYAISHLRTLVPLIWGHVVAWLVGLGIPAAIITTHKDLITEVIALLLSMGWYAGWRLLEPHLPKVLITLLLGYAQTPTYQTVVAPTPASAILRSTATVNTPQWPDDTAPPKVDGAG